MRPWSILLAGVTLCALGVAAYRTLYQYPKPQVPSNVGKQTPDFTLPDQDGKPFTLSSLRGAPVVLIFYRGYW